MKKFLMGPSGGTAAPMGAFMEHFVKSIPDGDEVYLVPEMWRTMVGLTDRKVIRATRALVHEWDCIGGSPMIPSCKNTNVFKIMQGDKTVDMSDVVWNFCFGYEGIVTVGGGGTTFQSQELYSAQGINSIVALATMDNDISCFDDVLGFETAVQNAGASIAACWNDAMTMQRPTMVFSMGYDCGRLAVNATKHAICKYGAEIDMLQIPETETSPEEVAAKINERYKGGAFTIVISEGCCKPSSGTADGIHKTYSTSEYAQKIMELTGIKFKVITADYRQRSGNPVPQDVLLAKKYASKASELIDQGKWNYAIGSVEGQVVALPFEEVIEVLKTQNSSSNWYGTRRVYLGAIEEIIA